MKRTLPLVLIAALAPAAAAAQGPACRVDLQTLLSVHASRRFEVRTLPGRLPPPPAQITEDVLVSQGGAASALRTLQTLCCDIPDVKRFASGISDRADLVQLRDLLASARVGFLRDCVIENDLTTPTGGRVLGTYEATWYGRGSRRNRFTVVFADAGTTALPKCGPEIQELIDGVKAFADALAEDPDRRVCGSAP
jgi:hypothetical protein